MKKKCKGERDFVFSLSLHNGRLFSSESMKSVVSKLFAFLETVSNIPYVLDMGEVPLLTKPHSCA